MRASPQAGNPKLARNTDHRRHTATFVCHGERAMAVTCRCCRSLDQPGRAVFALLTEQQIKRGARRSVKELKAAITAYMDARNADPSPSAGPRPPRISWRPSKGFAAVPSPSKLSVDRNF